MSCSFKSTKLQPNWLLTLDLQIHNPTTLGDLWHVQLIIRNNYNSTDLFFYAQGPQGVQGTPGVPGLPGAKGATGDPGVEGERGKQVS